MADSEQALALADLPSLTSDELEIIGIVVNVKGAERAINSAGINTVGFPYSISPGFLERNQHQTPEEAVDALETVGSLAYKAGLDVVAYISMAFGNPYGDPWSVDEVVAACDLLADTGIETISLADTVGLATPELLEEVIAAVLANSQSQAVRQSTSASISTRARTKPPQRSPQPTVPAAAASTPPSEDSAAAPSRRMSWSATSPRKQSSQHSAHSEHRCPGSPISRPSSPPTAPLQKSTRA